MARKPPKKLREAVDTLISWFENTDRKHTDAVLRFIASFPFAGEMEDVGIEPSIPLMGWLEFENIQHLMDAIETKEDVEYLVRKLISEDPED